MSKKGDGVKRKGSGLNNVNLTGCVFSLPRMVWGPGKPRCTFLFGDHADMRRAKVVVMAVARGARAVELGKWLEPRMRIAVTGMLESRPVMRPVGQVLDYWLSVSHVDPGPALVGESSEGAGINSFVITGTVTEGAEPEGMPGRDRCVFWMCDGDSKERCRLEVPVYLPRGRVTETSESFVSGDRVGVSGFLCSDPPRGSRIRPYRVVVNHVDEGFLALGGHDDE
jgi:hypothetical protein